MPGLKCWMIFLGFLMAGCTPVTLGLSAAKICSNIVKSAVAHRGQQQVKLAQERADRQLYPNDFLDVGDPLQKAIARLGQPKGQEQQEEIAYYLFSGQRIITDRGQAVSRDVKVAVDKENKITEIIVLDASETKDG